MFNSTDLLTEYQQQPFMDSYYNNWTTAPPQQHHQQSHQHVATSSSSSSNNNTPIAAPAPLLIGADMAPIQSTPPQHAEPAQLLTPPLTASAADATTMYGWPSTTATTAHTAAATAMPGMACMPSEMMSYVTPQSRPEQTQSFVVSSGIMTPETDPEFNVAQFPKDIVSPSISISCISPVADAAMVPQQQVAAPQMVSLQQQQSLQQHQHHPHGLYYTFPTPTDNKLLHPQPIYSSPATAAPSIQYITHPFAQPVGLQEPLAQPGSAVTTGPQPPLLLVSPVNVPQLGSIPIAQHQSPPQQLQPAAQFHPRAQVPVLGPAPVTAASIPTTITTTTPPIVPCVEDLQQTKMVKLSRMTASRIEMIKKLAEQKGIQPQIVESVLLLYTPAGREKYFKYLQIDDDMSRLDGEDIYIKITVNGGGSAAAGSGPLSTSEGEVQKQRVAAAAAAAKEAVLAQNAAQILYGSSSPAAAAANAAAAAAAANAAAAAAAASSCGSNKKKSRKNRRDYVKRPLNSFMLYRKSQTQSAMAYAVHSKLKLNHQNISQIVGLMWQTESKEVKDKFAYFAGREKEIHKVLHPDYKFCPQKKKKKMENDGVY